MISYHILTSTPVNVNGLTGREVGVGRGSSPSFTVHTGVLNWKEIKMVMGDRLFTI